MVGRFPRPLAVVGAATLATLGLSSCGLTDDLTGVSLGTTGAAAPQPSATVAVSPAGSTDVLPGTPVVVRAEQGRITAVEVVSDDGSLLPGTLSPDSRSWTAGQAAEGYGSRYTVQITAIDRNGLTTTMQEQFRTLVPDTFAEVSSVSPEPGSEFGVGIPISLTFDTDVVNKKAVEERLEVATPKPIAGAWRWLSDSQVEFRPKTYWPGNIDIAVTARLTGVEVAPGVWGEKDTTYKFRTTNSVVGKVDMDDYSLRVYLNGKLERTIPITTGKSGFETRSGVKVVLTKERYRLMDAASGGTDPSSPEYYRLTVEYAMRLTWSGEFLHAAPWSVGSQGYANVSHGCTGMSTSNAEWLYSISNLGDVYEYVGNDRQMGTGDNGITVWNVPWADWLADSEAGEFMTVPLGGSQA